MRTWRIVAALGLALLVAVTVWRAVGDLRDTRSETAAAGWGAGLDGDALLLARLIFGEANAEPYIGQVAVASVVLNRVGAPGFPDSIAGVIFQPDAFESVSNGQIWVTYPTSENIAAATAALEGWDPTYGALFFWNPYKSVNPWIWTRQIITQIGSHVFAR
ncbi:MAG: cell wall hydrolase [Ignavibacteriales bacterium]